MPAVFLRVTCASKSRKQSPAVFQSKKHLSLPAIHAVMRGAVIVCRFFMAKTLQEDIEETLSAVLKAAVLQYFTRFDVLFYPTASCPQSWR